MIDSKRQVAFIVLSDGPCSYSTFRPNEDANQWWSRRDALVRIIRASCWQGNQQPNDTVHSLSILFNTPPDKDIKGGNSHNGIIDADKIGLATIFPNKVCVPALVPTEAAVIQALRSAFQEAEQDNARGNNLNRGGGLVMQIDGKLFRYHVNTPSAAPSQDSKNSLSKKDMVRLVQQSASIDFLREHKLNGSVESVLKKVNKDDIQAAFQAFQDTIESSRVINAAPNSTVNESYKKALESSVFHLFNGILSDSRKRKREDPEPSSSATADTVVLFLHEDYPQELPIFLSQTIPLLEDRLPFRKVVCVLGGVRDIYPLEVDIILRVARQLHLPVLGANLGKVAEFTSKIIVSLVYHSKNARLFDAVGYLWRQEQQQQRRQTEGVVVSNNTQSSLDSALHSIYSSKTKTVMPVHSAEGSSHDHLVVLVALPVPFAQLSAALDQRERHIDLIQLLVATLWRSRIVHHTGAESVAAHATHSDIVLVDAEQSVFHVSQQAIVDIITMYHIAAPSEYQVLDMMLKLLQQHVSSVQSNDQSRIHDGRALTHCYFKPAAASANSPNTSLDYIVRDVLPEIYPVLRSKDGTKRVRFLNCYDASFMGRCLTGEEITSNLVDLIYDNSLTPNASARLPDGPVYILACFFLPLASPVSILHHWRYGKPPKCKPNDIASDDNEHDRRRLKRLGKLSKQVWDFSLHSSLVSQHPEKASGVRGSWSASTIVTMLQHWSYHGRLRPCLFSKCEEVEHV
eukprot:gene34456-41710_t